MVDSRSITVDGRFFTAGGERFHFRGVTYGTFRPREADGARFPETERIKLDFEGMNQAGFTVVRTYTEPSSDLLDVAADWDLRVLAGVHWLDWRYLLGASRRQARAVARAARDEIRTAARRLAGNANVLALCLGNEIPADVIRWYGTRPVAETVSGLAEVVREVDPDRLVTYANYPTAEYLPLEDLDFLTFNVFLEERDALRSYLTRLHHLAGDRPLVLGEFGLHAGDTAESEQRQADHLDWQLETALERGVAGSCIFSWTDEWWVGDEAVEGWKFGLTREDRSPRPALAVAARWNSMTVRDLSEEWRPLSVVVCAYNAAETLDECLTHTCALDYPNLEIIVVDDGSTDPTAEITRRHPRARLLTIEHGGLSVARNEGFRAARGEIVAYLDSDAYPSAEWPYYLVLAFDSRSVGGAGGPNVPPRDDPVGAQVVAQSPGGPVHVLIGDDRAEHVPGCNMAFWRTVLEEVGGFDPIYTAAGDDVDLCWKVLDRRWDIAFHPAALVWHHRRSGLRTYLRQQRGYGRAEALVEARHPDRFSPLGTARWRGRIYTSLAPSLWGQRIYRGLYGAASYQSVYQASGDGIDVAHQAGVPVAAVAIATAPATFFNPLFGIPALLAVSFLLLLGAADAARARPLRSSKAKSLLFRGSVAVHHLLQPLVRAWGRTRAGRLARRDLPEGACLPGPVQRLSRGVVLLPHVGGRADIAASAVARLRRHGFRAVAATGWEDHDARLVLTAMLWGEVVTSAHPVGWVQVRVRPRLRRRRLLLGGAAAAWLAFVSPWAAAAIACVAAMDVAAGAFLTAQRIPHLLAREAK